MGTLCIMIPQEIMESSVLSIIVYMKIARGNHIITTHLGYLTNPLPQQSESSHLS